MRSFGSVEIRSARDRRRCNRYTHLNGAFSETGQDEFGLIQPVSRNTLFLKLQNKGGKRELYKGRPSHLVLFQEVHPLFFIFCQLDCEKAKSISLPWLSVYTRIS